MLTGMAPGRVSPRARNPRPLDTNSNAPCLSVGYAAGERLSLYYRVRAAWFPPAHAELTPPRRYYGIAAAQAYRTYGNTSLLNLAETLWADVAAYQISSAQATSGRHPLRSVPFQRTCSVGPAGGVTVAGAVFSVRRTPRLGVPAAHHVHA
jgi:hypothetical protein